MNVSEIDAWGLDMDSLISVRAMPPVAPSNPYMAIPKHRSAHRLRNSTATRPHLSDGSSRNGATSEPGASTAPERHSLLSATYQSSSSSPAAKAGATLSGAPPPQSVPPALPGPSPTENETAQDEPCDQDIVVDAAITTREAEMNPSPSIPITGESTSSALLHTRKGSSLDLYEGSFPASRLLSIKTLVQNLSNTAMTPASGDGDASLAASVTGLPTTTASSELAGGPSVSVVGFRSL